MTTSTMVPPMTKAVKAHQDQQGKPTRLLSMMRPSAIEKTYWNSSVVRSRSVTPSPSASEYHFRQKLPTGPSNHDRLGCGHKSSKPYSLNLPDLFQNSRHTPSSSVSTCTNRHETIATLFPSLLRK